MGRPLCSRHVDVVADMGRLVLKLREHSLNGGTCKKDVSPIAYASDKNQFSLVYTSCGPNVYMSRKIRYGDSCRHKIYICYMLYTDYPGDGQHSCTGGIV
ncbi:hypothetical protein DPMN_134414 [Dreissena polymorpha]|uniref:Uncharacterized protein n=1 Tax=Dreissena polymorpha TaxID=45954 RepID=A0A9D4G1L1_DREPO|nr:hypothetical protein DPMN_134202 [Dreissena polymorpha]KAH3806100.1 hypothetical protein DPMN_134414 [Dreissena polymorpha]